MLESVGAGSRGSEPAGGEAFEQRVSRVSGFITNLCGLSDETARVDLAQMWKLGPNNPVSHLDNPLQLLPLCCSAAGLHTVVHPSVRTLPVVQR